MIGLDIIILLMASGASLSALFYTDDVRQYANENREQILAEQWERKSADCQLKYVGKDEEECQINAWRMWCAQTKRITTTCPKDRR